MKIDPNSGYNNLKKSQTSSSEETLPFEPTHIVPKWTLANKQGFLYLQLKNLSSFKGTYEVLSQYLAKSNLKGEIIPIADASESVQDEWSKATLIF